MSLSIGRARIDPSNPCTVEELLSAADTAMYRDKEAKRAGS